MEKKLTPKVKVSATPLTPKRTRTTWIKATGRPLRLTIPPLPETEEGRLAGRIRQLRVERGWSQADLAKRMSQLGPAWHQTTVAKTERAERELKYSEVRALAEALSIPLERLLDLEVGGDGTNVVAELHGDLQKLEAEERVVRLRLEYVDQDIDDLTAQRKELSTRLAQLKREITVARRALNSARSK